MGLTSAEWTLGASLIAFNGLIQVLPRGMRGPVSFAAGTALSAIATRQGISFREQGLHLYDLRGGLSTGFWAALPVSLIVLAGTIHPVLRGEYRGDPVAGASGWHTAYEILVRIPFGTALSEEVAFRGVLPAFLSRDRSTYGAAVLASILFGLFHIGPAARRLKTGAARVRSLPAQTGSVAASIVLTSLAGLFLSWLRARSGAIVAPWAVHCAANCTGYAAVLVANREVRRLTPDACWIG